MDRLASPTEHQGLGGDHGPLDRRTGPAGIPINLALGIGAQVIAVHGKTPLIAQRPGARQHGLGLQGRSRSPRADLVGHHPQQVALQGHLLHQAPTAIGIPLQPEGTGINPALPAQATGSINFQRALQHRACAARSTPGSKG